MRPPFTSAADVMTVTATEFMMDKAGAGRIVTMSGVEISREIRKERMGTEAMRLGYIPATNRVENFCMLINCVLTLAG